MTTNERINIEEQIAQYISEQPEPKRSEMQSLHQVILKLMPACRIWFLDGKNEEGKIVSNPNIGYGSQIISTANGKSKDFYQIGMSANTVGISVYILGLEDKKFLVESFGKRIGKASVSGYCIKFKSLKDIDLEVLQEAISSGLGESMP